MIRTLEGRVGSGKTTRVLHEVAKETERGGRALLIVPEQMTLAAELQLAATLEAPGFLLAEVLSPTRLMRRVAEAAGGLAGRVIIDERGRAMALRATLFELNDALTVYRSCGGRDGFIEWLADLMGECSQNAIGPTELRLAADALKADDPLSLKLYDLAAIHERYLDLLEGRFLDTTEAVQLFLENIYNTDFLRDARVWVDGFDIMPPRTLRMMAGLSSAVKEMTIALTLGQTDERSEGLFVPVAQSFARLADMAEEYGVPVTRETLARDAYRSPEIGHLEQEWDAHPAIKYPSAPEDIELVHARTRREECEFAAASILALHRDEGIPFGAMACALGDEAAYAPLMRRALSARSLPHFIAQPATAAGHPAVRWWLAAMEAATTGMRPEAMNRVLRSGWSGCGEDAADRLLNRMVERNMKAGAWERAIPDDDALDAARARVAEPLAAYAARVKGKPTAREMAHAAYLLLEEGGIYPRLISEIDACAARGEGVTAEQHAQVWNRILEGLDQAVELLGERALPHAEFLRALQTGLAASQLAALPPRPDQVMVTSVARVKGSGIRVLFVLGLNDGVLPSAPGAEGLLTDDEKTRANGAYQKHGMKLHLNGTRERSQSEAFSIYSALTLPTDRLYLSYAAAGEDGSALRESLLVERLRAIFPALVSAPYPRNARESGLSALWQVSESLRVGDIPSETAAAWRYFLAWEDAAQDVSRIRSALEPGTPDAAISPGAAQSLFGQRSIGITRLETYAKCPCLHLIQNGLRPRELYAPDVRPVDAGSVYHDALDALMELVALSGVPWTELSEQVVESLAESAMEKPFAELLDAPGYEGGLIAARAEEMRRTLRKTAHAVAYQLRASLFQPYGREIAFGEGKPFPPLDIALEDGGFIRLEGRIDRVDLHKKDGAVHLRVIDYKSGNVKLQWETVQSGLTLQLPLYALESERAMQGDTAGLFYERIADKLIDTTDDLPGDEDDAAQRLARQQKLEGMLLDDPGILSAMDSEIAPGTWSGRLPVRMNKDGTLSKSPSLLAREEMRTLLATAEKTAAHIAGRMLGGEAPAEPARLDNNKTACSYCLYQGICLRR